MVCGEWKVWLLRRMVDVKWRLYGVISFVIRYYVQMTHGHFKGIANSFLDLMGEKNMGKNKILIRCSDLKLKSLAILERLGVPPFLLTTHWSDVGVNI